MNNRYLYRAKRTDNGEWVEGAYYIEPYTDKRFIIQWNSTGLGFNEFIEVDGASVCQFTGKTDIEKNLIFEHDVVSFLDATSTECGYSEHWQAGEVLWDDETASFQVTERLSAESYEVLEDCKVLGNTIDNPELLEVGE